MTAPLLQIGVITLFPEMFAALRVGGVTARALTQGLLTLSCWNPRDYTHDKTRRVDDRPYGGGPGMVMQVQPLRDTLTAAKATLSNAHVVYLSPQGRPLTQTGVLELLTRPELLLVAGRYEGIDERLLERDIDEEWSIGDYVLSGGELPAMVLIDALARQLPGALGHQDSAANDSFYNGLLDYPHYTRPEIIDGQAVPTILLQGHHAQITQWRQQQALLRTWRKRPDLLQKQPLTPEQHRWLQQFIQEYEGD